MKEQYQGVNRWRLVEALADQELVSHDKMIAGELADEVTLQELQTGKQLYLRGDPGNNVLYFILSGSVDLLNQDHHIATLKSGQCLGEFPILDPGLSYTVTAVSREQSVVAGLPEGKFRSIATDHPEIWKHTARMLVKRLCRTSGPKQGPSGTLPLGDLTVRRVWESLTVGQFWGVIVACCSVLATVAGVAYKLGSAAR